MKILIYILLLIELALLLPGLWFEWQGQSELADKFLGFFTLVLFVVLIPVFLYWRLKGRDLSRYTFRPRNRRDDV